VYIYFFNIIFYKKGEEYGSRTSKLLSIISGKNKKSLIKNGFDVWEAKSKGEALQILKDKIPQSASIGTGGSRTLEQIGFFEHFNKENYPGFLDRQTPGQPPEVIRSVQRQILTADVFLCSANAVTTEGQLLFIDYNGNRNAAATYGPDQRIFVVGWNKITTSLEHGFQRARDIAAVLNNIRFGTSNPCTKKGHCVQCNGENTLCRVTTTITRCEPKNTGVVLIVHEDLGF
jgi:L-lactate utilization protein LutB